MKVTTVLKLATGIVILTVLYKIVSNKEKKEFTNAETQTEEQIEQLFEIPEESLFIIPEENSENTNIEEEIKNVCKLEECLIEVNKEQGNENCLIEVNKEENSLDSKSLIELKQIAKERKIKGYTKMNKATLLNSLK